MGIQSALHRIQFHLLSDFPRGSSGFNQPVQVQRCWYPLLETHDDEKNDLSAFYWMQQEEQIEKRVSNLQIQTLVWSQIIRTRTKTNYLTFLFLYHFIFNVEVIVWGAEITSKVTIFHNRSHHSTVSVNIRDYKMGSPLHLEDQMRENPTLWWSWWKHPGRKQLVWRNGCVPRSHWNYYLMRKWTFPNSTSEIQLPMKQST